MKKVLAILVAFLFAVSLSAFPQDKQQEKKEEKKQTKQTKKTKQDNTKKKKSTQTKKDTTKKDPIDDIPVVKPKKKKAKKTSQAKKNTPKKKPVKKPVVEPKKKTKKPVQAKKDIPKKKPVKKPVVEPKKKTKKPVQAKKDVPKKKPVKKPKTTKPKTVKPKPEMESWPKDINIGNTYFPRTFLHAGKEYKRGYYRVILTEKDGNPWFRVLNRKKELLFEEMAVVKPNERKKLRKGYRVKKEMLKGYEYYRIMVTKPDDLVIAYFLIKSPLASAKKAPGTQEKRPPKTPKEQL